MELRRTEITLTDQEHRIDIEPIECIRFLELMDRHGTVYVADIIFYIRAYNENTSPGIEEWLCDDISILLIYCESTGINRFDQWINTIPTDKLERFLKRLREHVYN